MHNNHDHEDFKHYPHTQLAAQGKSAPMASKSNMGFSFCGLHRGNSTGVDEKAHIGRKQGTGMTYSHACGPPADVLQSPSYARTTTATCKPLQRPRAQQGVPSRRTNATSKNSIWYGTYPGSQDVEIQERQKRPTPNGEERCKIARFGYRTHCEYDSINGKT